MMSQEQVVLAVRVGLIVIAGAYFVYLLTSVFGFRRDRSVQSGQEASTGRLEMYQAYLLVFVIVGAGVGYLVVAWLELAPRYSDAVFALLAAAVLAFGVLEGVKTVRSWRNTADRPRRRRDADTDEDSD
jgi:hypothetical protein